MNTGPPPGIPPGARPFAGFWITGELGRGGMGAVYRAYHPAQKQEFALKIILNTDDDAALDAVARFRKEAEAMAAVGGHPNVVQIHASGTSNGYPYYVMELVDGTDFEGIASRLPLERRVSILTEVGRALGFAHEMGIVHRDIKPANILVERETGRALVTDFGLAKIEDQQTKLTETGTILGTLHYMSPEQAGGETEEISERSDVYSLGAVLYEAMTGQRPFEGESEFNIITSILTKAPTPPRSIDPDLPEALETICLVAMEKEPEDRYANAREMAEDLERYLSGEPIQAERPSAVQKIVRAVRRHPVLTGSLVFLVLLLGVGGTVAWSLIQADRIATWLGKTQPALVETKEKWTAGLQLFEEAPGGTPTVEEVDAQIAHLVRLIDEVDAWEAPKVPSYLPTEKRSDIRDRIGEIEALQKQARPLFLRRRVEAGVLRASRPGGLDPERLQSLTGILDRLTEPDPVWALDQRATIQFGLGNSEKALELWTSVTELVDEPGKTPAGRRLLFRHARALLTLKRVDPLRKLVDRIEAGGVDDLTAAQRLTLGRIFLARGLNRKARLILTQAQKATQNPSGEIGLQALFWRIRAQKKREKIEDDLKRLLSLESGTSEGGAGDWGDESLESDVIQSTWAALAAAFVYAGHPAGRLGLLEGVEAPVPGPVAARRAPLYFAVGKTGQAREDWKRAWAERHLWTPKPHLRTARLLPAALALENGSREDARRLLAEMGSTGPGWGAACLHLDLDQPDAALEHHPLARAEAALRGGDGATALSACETEAEAGNTHALALRSAARAKDAPGKAARDAGASLAAHRKARSPLLTDLLTTVSDALGTGAEDRMKSLLVACRVAHRLDPCDPDIAIQLARLEARVGDGLAGIRQLEVHHPLLPELAMEEARLHRTGARPRDAAEAYTRLFASPITARRLAAIDALRDEERNSEARRELRRWIQAGTSFAEVAISQGTGVQTRARKALERLRKRGPHRADLAVWLARLRGEDSETADAVRRRHEREARDLIDTIRNTRFLARLAARESHSLLFSNPREAFQTFAAEGYKAIEAYRERYDDGAAAAYLFAQGAFAIGAKLDIKVPLLELGTVIRDDPSYLCEIIAKTQPKESRRAYDLLFQTLDLPRERLKPEDEAVCGPAAAAALMGFAALTRGIHRASPKAQTGFIAAGMDKFLGKELSPSAHFEYAVRQLNRAVRIRPESLGLRLMLARALFALARTTDSDFRSGWAEMWAFSELDLLWRATGHRPPQFDVQLGISLYRFGKYALLTILDPAEADLRRSLLEERVASSPFLRNAVHRGFALRYYLVRPETWPGRKVGQPAGDVPDFARPLDTHVQRYVDGLLALAAEEPGRAIEAFQRASSSEPVPSFFRGLAHEGRSEWTTAGAAFRTARPAGLAASAHEAGALAADGRVDEARTLLSDGLENRSLTRLYSRWAPIHERVDIEKENAETEEKEFLARRGNAASHLLDRLRISPGAAFLPILRSGNLPPETRNAYLEQALTLAPDEPALHLFQGRHLLVTGKRAEARAVLIQGAERLTLPRLVDTIEGGIESGDLKVTRELCVVAEKRLGWPRFGAWRALIETKLGETSNPLPALETFVQSRPARELSDSIPLVAGALQLATDADAHPELQAEASSIIEKWMRRTIQNLKEGRGKNPFDKSSNWRKLHALLPDQPRPLPVLLDTASRLGIEDPSVLFD